MKIESKVMMINVEHSIAIGKNKAITMDVLHQVCLFEGQFGDVEIEMDVMDYVNVKFMGMDIPEGYNEFKKFKTQMLEFGIDVDELVDDQCVGLFSSNDIKELKSMFK